MNLLATVQSINNPILQALAAGVFTWALTACGAFLVFFFKKDNQKILDCSLGFTGGVMVAASFWSLLAPSINYTQMQNDLGLSSTPVWVPSSVGFFLGAAFLYTLDKIIPHLHINSPVSEAEGVQTQWNKTILLVLAITMHNIPEGLAIGVAFGALAHNIQGFEIGGAVALAIGIGIQNFPEGFAVAMPLRRQKIPKLTCFWWGQLSAVVEPFAAVLGAAAVMYMLPILPYALAFAAGAMMFIVVEEVIPESQRSGYADQATMGFVLGFIVMMILDVSLG
jgi:zinc transporter, ZIP family